MSEVDRVSSLIIRHKRGIPVYEKNPSLIDVDDIKKRKPVQMSEQKGFVIGGEGEIIAQGTALFYEYKEVDSKRFVKLYQEGVRQTTGLGKPGAQLFEFICVSMYENPNSDRVELNHYLISKSIEMTERTYQRGLHDLLDREIIFRSSSDNFFFINIRYVFNGDRLAFVNGFKRKPQQKVLK
jgi:hypothetical protein